MELEQQRALAAEIFPDRWAAACATPGIRGQKFRYNVRKQAVEEHLRRPLRAAGESCLTCAHRLKNPGGLKGHYCDLNSGGGAYMTTTLDGLCSRHSRKDTPNDR